MKKLLYGLVSLIVPCVMQATPQIAVRIFPTSALSVDSVIVNQNRTNIMFGLSGQNVPTNRNSSASAWHVIPSNKFEYGDMIASTAASSFHLWRAESPGAFPSEWGQRLLWVVHITSVNGLPFRSADVLFQITGSDSSLHLIGGLATNSSTQAEIRYSSTLWGLSYGGDRQKGTSDDRWYVAGESSLTPVDEIFYVGVRSSYTATTMAGVHGAKATMLAPNYYISCRYYMRDGTGTGSGTATVTTAPRVTIAKEDNGLVLIHGQPDSSYMLQSTLVLTTPPSAIWWITKPGVYKSGEGTLNVVNPLSQYEFFRAVYVPPAGFAPAGVASASSGISSNNED